MRALLEACQKDVAASEGFLSVRSAIDKVNIMLPHALHAYPLHANFCWSINTARKLADLRTGRRRKVARHTVETEFLMCTLAV